MIESQLEQASAAALGVPASGLPSALFAASAPAIGGPTARDKWDARHALARHRAETERLRVLVEFLARPIHAHGGPEPDPDILTAYNLAIEAALQGIRRSTLTA